MYLLVLPKTRTVRVRVPYPYCAACTKNHLWGRTHTIPDTYIWGKKSFFELQKVWYTKILEIKSWIPYSTLKIGLSAFLLYEIGVFILYFWVLVWVQVYLETLK